MADERTRREPPASFPRLPDLPAGRYSDPAFFELERDALMKRGWVNCPLCLLWLADTLCSLFQLL